MGQNSVPSQSRNAKDCQQEILLAKEEAVNQRKSRKESEILRKEQLVTFLLFKHAGQLR